MTSERWQQIKDVLGAALEHPAGERRGFVDRACGEDRELRREVATLVELDDQLGDFFERPAAIVFRRDPPGTGGEAGPAAAPSIEDLPTGGETLGEPAAQEARERATAMAGRRIGSYKIRRRLSHGGMGVVYLAERDGAYHQRVALKIIKRDMVSDEVVRFFHNERQILADLEHPSIARLLDGGTTGEGLPYLVMEYIEGEPIDRDCDHHQLSVRQRIDLFLRVCEAVHFAHQNLVIHCDLKPGNILITREGEPKLLDFGIARLERAEGAEAGPERSSPQGVPLTPNYASPEQIRGRTMTTASDVYSLGVLLYRVLTGQLPYDFEVQPLRQVLAGIAGGRVRPPSAAVLRPAEVRTAAGIRTPTPESLSRNRGCDPRTLRRLLAGDLDSIVLRALASEPLERYRSVEQLAADLRRHLEDRPVIARKPTLLYRGGKFVRRNTPVLATAALVLLLLVGFSLTTTFLWQRAERQRDRAEQLNDLLVRVFSASDPEPGEEVTARDLLDRGRAGVLADLKEQPELYAPLASTLGNVYRKLGHYEEAEQLLGESLEIRRRLSRGDDERLAEGLGDLATLRYDQGSFARAESLLRQALAMERRLYGGEHPEVLDSLNDLATVLAHQGRYAEAEEQLRELAALRRRLSGDDDPDYVTALNNLAFVLTQQGEYRRAPGGTALPRRSFRGSGSSSREPIAASARCSSSPASLESARRRWWIPSSPGPHSRTRSSSPAASARSSTARARPTCRCWRLWNVSAASRRAGVWCRC